MPHNAVQMMMDAKVLCGFWWFLQIESKCKVAREKGMSFSVWQAAELGFVWTEKPLYITCLIPLNQMISWFCSKWVICIFAN